MASEDVAIVIVTAPKGSGASIARQIVEKRLAACVNIVGGVRSIYWWEGRIQDDEEELLVIKTRRDAVESLIGQIKGIHPYSVPEILVVPVIAGNSDYMKWVLDEVRVVGPG